MSLALIIDLVKQLMSDLDLDMVMSWLVGVFDLLGLCNMLYRKEAPIEEIAVIKKDGKLFVDVNDGSGENVATEEEPVPEAGRARK